MERTAAGSEEQRPAAQGTKPRTIAIDGPVAAGKTAVGQRLAERLGYRFVDTGLMYRAVTLAALTRGVDVHDAEALGKLARQLDVNVTGGDRVEVNTLDVTSRLRSAEVGEAVSLVSRVPAVREAMVARQRALAGGGNVVMAGRDIGTVVLPDADLKIYLDASAGERVRRRHEELVAAGRQISEEEVREELALRDRIDSGREVSPLRPAEDAVVINTDGLSLDEVVERILELASCR